MCRCKDEHSGGRRCPSDNSESRRLRKHNAAAKAAFQKVPTPLIANTTTILPVAYLQESPTIETIKNNIACLHSLKEILNSSRPETNEDPVILPDGNYIQINDYLAQLVNMQGEVLEEKDTRSLLATEAEKLTTLIGSQINTLAEQQSGIKDTEIFASETEKFEAAKKKEEEIQQKFKIIKNEILEKYETFPNFFEQAKNPDDKTATTFYKQYKALSETLNQSQGELNQYAHNGSPEAWEAIAHQRKHLLTILKDIRPMGGTVNVANNSHKAAATILQEAITYYPEEWINASNQNTPPRVKKTTKRAHYTNGAFQHKFKTRIGLTSTLKPSDWVPDPEKASDLGTWVKMNEHNQWKDPETGMTYEHYTKPGQQGWMRSKVEYYHPPADSDPNITPYGKGWIKAIVKEETYNHETAKIEKTDKDITIWYREAYKRIRTESTSQPELTISGYNKEAQTGIALHEFAHRVEASGKTGQHIKTMEEAFLKRRTTNPETGQREALVKIYPNSKEYGRADNFIDLYMGKEYDAEGYREVLSTGAEALFSKSFGGFAGLGRRKPDPDMKNFIVGLWASA